MPQLVTRQTLRERARELSDMTNSQFVTDSTFNLWIEEEARALYDFVIGKNEDYEVLTLNFSIASGNTQAVPSDFYKIRGLDQASGAGWKAVRKFNFAERDKYLPTSDVDLRHASVMYRLIGNEIHILPEDNAVGDYRLWYIPTMVSLTTDASTLDARNGWDTYIVLGAAIRALAKEESDASSLVQMRGETLNRILAALERDYAEPERISDVRKICISDYY